MLHVYTTHGLDVIVAIDAIDVRDMIDTMNVMDMKGMIDARRDICDICYMRDRCGKFVGVHRSFTLIRDRWTPLAIKLR